MKHGEISSQILIKCRMKIQPLSDHVLIETIQEPKKKGSIILPDTVDKERSEKGKIVAVGPGSLDKNGNRVPIDVKKGNVVLFKKYSPDEVKVDGKEYLIVKEEDILAILN
jgi:chaperonin GroES